MSANPLLSIEGLTASVDEKTILHNVNLNVAAGETHVLMGPNGAGKSTLGHLVMGDPVYTVNDGRIVFDGQDITELTTDKRSRAGLFLSFQAPVEIPGVPLSSFLRASIAGRPGLEMKGKEFRRRAQHGYRLPQPRAGRGFLGRREKEGRDAPASAAAAQAGHPGRD